MSSSAVPPSAVTKPDGAPRSVLVTGASRGIGRAVAAAFADAGDLVAGVSRSGAAPQGVLPLSADVTDGGALTRAVATAAGRHGDVEVLVTCAGVSRDALAARTDPDTWDKIISTNLGGAFNAVHAVLPGMMRLRCGRIVLVSSVIAARGGVGLAAYGASKGGVEGLTRALAREVAPRGVTVNAVAPGLIDTEMTARLSERARSAYLRAIPVGRLGSVEEVVAPVLFLASPGSSYITGTVLGVDGGLGMGR